MTLLKFENFSLGLRSEKTVYNLLDNLNFEIEEGHALGIVGESGCGKSMTSLSVMNLLPNVAQVQGGQIWLKGENLLAKSEKEMADICGKEVSIIFQEPMTSLNPVLTVGFQIGEMFRRHANGMSKQEIREKSIALLERVGIPSPESRIDQYPHQFSGGMRQRVMIAMAIACEPSLLIADEPTTALDVTIQAQVLDIMAELKKSGSLMIVTHNLGIVAEICDDVVVMYAGHIVEKGTVQDVFTAPSHPYTTGLMAAIPTLSSKREKLYSVPGIVPGVKDFGTGCRFAPRCEKCLGEQCYQNKPPVTEISDGHSVMCWLYTKEDAQ